MSPSPSKTNESTLNIVQRAYREVGIGNPTQLGLEDFFTRVLRPAIVNVFRQKSWVKGGYGRKYLEAIFDTQGITEDPARVVERIMRAQIMAATRAKISATLKKGNLVWGAKWLLDGASGERDLNKEKLFAYIQAVITLLLDNLLAIPDTNGKKTAQKALTAEQLARGHNTAFTHALFRGKAIEETLANAGIPMTAEELKYFTINVLCGILKSCSRDPLEDGIVRVARNFKEELTDEKIMQAMSGTGIEIKEEYLQRELPPKTRFRIAVKYIKSTQKGLQAVATNLKTKLSNSAIHKILADEEILIEEYKIAQIITPGIRLHLAVNHLQDPTNHIKRAAHYTQGELSTPKIISLLRAEDIIMSEEEIDEIMPLETRLKWAVDFAIHSKKFPKERIQKAARRCRSMLTDEKLHKKLIELDREKTTSEGITPELIDQLLPLKERLALALKYPRQHLTKRAAEAALRKIT